MKIKILFLFDLILLLMFLLIPIALDAIKIEPYHITAFISPAGEIDNLLTYSSYSTDCFWNQFCKKLPTYNHFCQKSFLLYSEYAINRQNSVTFNGGYSTIQESLNGNSCGFEDLELGWKHLIQAKKDAAFTVQIIGLIPMGDKKSSLRYGILGMQVDLLYSRIFDLIDHKAWYDWELGYRYYRGFPSDQILTSLTLGTYIYSQIQIIAAGHLFYGLFNGKSKCNFNNVAFHPNFRLLTGQLECVIQILSRSSISLGVYHHLWGQNVGIGGGYYCALWLDF
jgi:protein XagA